MTEPKPRDPVASAAPADAIAADLARTCPLMARSRQLADWVDGRACAVTPGGALRPAEVPAAAAILGLPAIERVRRAADVPLVHQAWLAACGSGLIAVGPKVATVGELSATWPIVDDATARAAWLAGLRAVCSDLSGRTYPESLLLLVMLVLEHLPDVLAVFGQLLEVVLRAQGPNGVRLELARRVDAAASKDDYLHQRVDPSKPYSWLMPAAFDERSWDLFSLLQEFGALTDKPQWHDSPNVTELGRWAAATLRAELPQRIGAHLSAAQLLDQVATVGDHTEIWSAAWPWLTARTSLDAARDLLRAAAGNAPAQRLAAVGLVEDLGEAALPAWREMVGSADVGPHARAMLDDDEKAPSPEPDDAAWLALESAAAGLAISGADEALSRLSDGRPEAGVSELIELAATGGHPQAALLAQALQDFADSGAPRTIDQALQFKVTLDGSRPPIWRRVIMPAPETLADLHEAIRVLFGWDGDHLHVFEFGKRYFSDPFFQLDGASDEYDARLAAVFSSIGTKIKYTYDLGTRWEHEIRLEKVFERSPEQVLPQCTAFAGDSPVQYPYIDEDDDWDADAEDAEDDDEGDDEEGGDEDEDAQEDDSQADRTFDLDKVNARLEALGGR